ncbi:uncharacterized protein LAESUDRAFT_195210 [Laetiporus sulphureus 93-53]|uniref:G protein-coupled receptor GPR1/2/3 C-terminal domain-containing protein n=1 Tax=Laetiporus sulphureus 93-53 TaxID=1314785 RepID=A0A165E121_9APHY|nr:uncharacterized protein LAESUDRAFT_195210 [Laetiporus sulphureus 93-53]KZT06044.1 hypothetical protein LAESUDRAFT_195210 [Laetiporus sulphureus 93-53]
MHRATIFPYKRGQAPVLMVIVVFAILSILAVGFILIHVSWVSIHALLVKRGMAQGRLRKRSFFQTQLGAYTVSLLLSNLLTSIALTIDNRWLQQDHVQIGALCSAQGFILLLGNTAGAYFTGTIAVHAFNTLVCHNRLPAWFCKLAVVSGWVIAAVIAILPFLVHERKRGPVYGFDGLSCSISMRHSVLTVLLQLLPMFLAISISLVFYILIYLVLRGTMVIRGGLKFNFSSEARRSAISTAEHSLQYHTFIRAVVRSMFWYPVAYTVLTLAPTVTDLMKIAGDQVPFSLHIVADTSTAMFGLANAFVLWRTLRLLAPFIANCTVSQERSNRGRK